MAGKLMARTEETTEMLADPGYTPERLLTQAMAVMKARNERQLCQLLDIDQASVCRIRKRAAPVTAGIAIAIMERTGFSLSYVYELAGMLKYRNVRHEPAEPAGHFSYDHKRVLMGQPQLVHMHDLAKGQPGTFPLFFSPQV
jgi:hypothetical protein